MAGARSLLSVLLAVCAVSWTSADSCGKPEVSATSYTTQDATVLTNIAYVAEFSLKCSNAIKGLPLYAEVNGKILPAARTSDDNHYQVSWTEEVKKARSGNFNINLFDEEGYAALRKAIRSGDDLGSVKPLVSVLLNHPGSYQGPWVNSEFMAAALAVVVWYCAYTFRNKLLY
ncbi:translocon-associated protein subunit delta-like [Neocloeon triangulifer]|uniref:translocon-associated protein subunit delta-like n=1 Tax=Neocloeon triangulifer TaxID=2078957 RepID=UPI00286F8564|nr:translocon-associated protein subunit delta-like [Neocloeon triangulifer]